MSLYRYVGNLPTVYADPTGLGAGGAIGYPGDPSPLRPAKICDNFPCEDNDASLCTRQKCRETLQMIKDIAKQVPYYFPLDACQKWAFDFEQKLGRKLKGNPCVKEDIVKGYHWFVPWAGHAAYESRNGGQQNVGRTT